MRLVLRVVSLFFVICGIMVAWNDSVLGGVLICLVWLPLLLLSIHNSRAKANKALAVVKKVSAKTSTLSLSFLYVVLIVVPVWILLDACFQPALSWARVDLRIPDEAGLDLIKLNSMGAPFLLDAGKPTYIQSIHSVSALGPRIGATIFILCVTAASILLSVMYIVLNAASKKYILVLTVALLCISALVHQRENVLWFAVQQRVAKKLPSFRKALTPLIRKWPTTSGRLPEIGEYSAYERFPDQLYFHNSTSYGVDETFGAFVTQLPDKGVCFSLEPHYLFQLEYHPPKHVPLAKLQSEFWTQHLIRFTEIEEGWYLTEYKSVRR